MIKIVKIYFLYKKIIESRIYLKNYIIIKIKKYNMYLFIFINKILKNINFLL